MNGGFLINIREEAVVDLQSSVRWYNEQKEGLGTEFLDDLDSAIQVLKDGPLMFQIVHRDLRRLTLTRFPFIIVYQVQGNVVTVLRVFHTSRGPRGWKRMRP